MFGWDFKDPKQPQSTAATATTVYDSVRILLMVSCSEQLFIISQHRFWKRSWTLWMLLSLCVWPWGMFQDRSSQKTPSDDKTLNPAGEIWIQGLVFILQSITKCLSCRNNNSSCTNGEFLFSKWPHHHHLKRAKIPEKRILGQTAFWSGKALHFTRDFFTSIQD